MKSITLNILLLLIALPIFQAAAPAQEVDHLEVLFMRLYPDLVSHKDVVTASMNAIVATGYKAPTIYDLFTRTATDSRATLQSRNPDAKRPVDDAEFTAKEEAASREAQQQFPLVLVQNSPLDQRVRQERANLTKIYPAYFADPRWPLYLTQGCAAALEENEKQPKAPGQSRTVFVQPPQPQKQPQLQKPPQPTPQPPPQQPTENVTLEELQQIVDIYTKLQQMTSTQDQQSLEMIQLLQSLKGGRSRTRQKQTPAEANAWWQEYQRQQQLNQLQSEVSRLRQQQRR